MHKFITRYERLTVIHRRCPRSCVYELLLRCQRPEPTVRAPAVFRKASRRKTLLYRPTSVPEILYLTPKYFITTPKKMLAFPPA